MSPKEELRVSPVILSAAPSPVMPCRGLGPEHGARGVSGIGLSPSFPPPPARFRRARRLHLVSTLWAAVLPSSAASGLARCKARSI